MGRNRHSIRNMPDHKLVAKTTFETRMARRQAVLGSADFVACTYCVAVIPRRKITLDHAKAKSRGGTDEPGNLVPACERCNHEKGARSKREFLAWLRTENGRAWLAARPVRRGWS